MSESGANRQKATTELRCRAKDLRRRSDQLIALADAVDRIESSATDYLKEGSDGRHPYIGIGSDAEIALWELACKVRYE